MECAKVTMDDDIDLAVSKHVAHGHVMEEAGRDDVPRPGVAGWIANRVAGVLVPYDLPPVVVACDDVHDAVATDVGDLRIVGAAELTVDDCLCPIPPVLAAGILVPRHYRLPRIAECRAIGGDDVQFAVAV